MCIIWFYTPCFISYWPFINNCFALWIMPAFCFLFFIHCFSCSMNFIALWSCSNVSLNIFRSDSLFNHSYFSFSNPLLHFSYSHIRSSSFNSNSSSYYTRIHSLFSSSSHCCRIVPFSLNSLCYIFSRFFFSIWLFLSIYSIYYIISMILYS